MGSGHLHRAEAVQARLRTPMVVLSSLPQPRRWHAEWVGLPRDDDGDADDVTAAGRLHWVPRHHAGLRNRMAVISAWIADRRPDLVVADVSAEVALLARLHGVPVASIVLPGDRSDPAHQLGYGVSDLLVATWPEEANDVVSGLGAELTERLVHVGGLSRFEAEPEVPRRPGRPRVTLLQGGGGAALSEDAVDRARQQSPGWEWTVLGPAGWSEDPWPGIRDADVVVTHAGQNAVAEVAAARRPAVVIPEKRPHGEQVATASALAEGSWPALVEQHWPTHGWADRLERARRLDGRAWRSWVDGKAATRLTHALEEAAAHYVAKPS